VLLLWARLDDFRGKLGERAAATACWPSRAADTDGAAWFWLGRYNALHDQVEQAAQHYRTRSSSSRAIREYLYGLLGLYWSGHTA